MYMLLSHLPPLLLPSKTSFARYVKENVFVPLGMNSTTYSYAIAKASGHLVEGFGRDNLNRTEDFFGKGTPRVLPVVLGGESEDGNCKSTHFFKKEEYLFNRATRRIGAGRHIFLCKRYCES